MPSSFIPSFWTCSTWAEGVSFPSSPWHAGSTGSSSGWCDSTQSWAAPPPSATITAAASRSVPLPCAFTPWAAVPVLSLPLFATFGLGHWEVQSAQQGKISIKIFIKERNHCSSSSFLFHQNSMSWYLGNSMHNICSKNSNITYLKFKSLSNNFL